MQITIDTQVKTVLSTVQRIASWVSIPTRSKNFCLPCVVPQFVSMANASNTFRVKIFNSYTQIRSSQRRTNNKLNPHMTLGLESSADTLARAQRSHHCAISANHNYVIFYVIKKSKRAIFLWVRFHIFQLNLLLLVHEQNK